VSPDPLRLFEDAGASEELRDDLRHARNAAAPGYDVEAGLVRFSAFIGAGPTSGVISTAASGGAAATVAATSAAGASATATSATAAPAALGAAKITTSALGAKALAGALVIGVLGAGALRLAASPDEALPSSAPIAVMAPSEAQATEPRPLPGSGDVQPPSNAGAADVPVPAAVAPAPTVSAAAKVPAAAAVEPTAAELAARSMKDETDHLGALRAAARSDHQAAVRMADEGHARFPKGIFWQEREVVAITSLVALGRREQARSRAQAFLARHPDSPSAELLRRVVGD
jgi:hypothetical protein